MKRTARELTDLYIAVTIMILMVAYHLGANVFGGFDRVLDPEISGMISNGIFIWLVGMLWIAYQRWKGISRKESVLDDIISSTGLEVVMVVNEDQEITMCNEAIAPVFGYHVDEVIGRPLEMLLGEERVDSEELARIDHALKSVGFHRGEFPGESKGEQSMILEIATAARKKGEGQVLMIQDITERKEHEERLRIAKEEAETANAAKEDALRKLEASYRRLRELEVHRDNLIHMVCHDMKAPLQVLILQLDILKDMVIEKLDNDELESVDTLLAYSRQLEIMVHSMLDLSKMESGNLPMKLKTGHLTDTVEESLSFVRAMGQESTLAMDAPTDPRMMKYDVDVMQRVLINLLFNAVKYSPAGGEVKVGIEERDDHAYITVKDQGPGIPEEYQQTIFEKFGQVKVEGHERRGSTGLGLTFCKMAVESHGGEIGVNSVEGEGSTFYFTLPYEPVLPKPKKQETLAGIPAL